MTVKQFLDSILFYICEYLEITPKEFFNTDAGDPVRLNDLLSSAKGLSDEQLEHLIAIAKWIK